MYQYVRVRHNTRRSIAAAQYAGHVAVVATHGGASGGPRPAAHAYRKRVAGLYRTSPVGHGHELQPETLAVVGVPAVGYKDALVLRCADTEPGAGVDGNVRPNLPSNDGVGGNGVTANVHGVVRTTLASPYELQRLAGNGSRRKRVGHRTHQLVDAGDCKLCRPRHSGGV